MTETGAPSVVRFWSVFAAFLGAVWFLDRLFAWEVARFGLDDSTRLLAAHVREAGVSVLLANLFLHALPKVAAVGAVAAIALRAIGAEAQDALRVYRPSASASPWIAGFATVGIVQWVLLRLDGGAFRLAGDPLSFLAIYLVRFLPSAAVEEITFRGSLFSSVRDRISPRAAWVVSLGLFALAHGYGGPRLILSSLATGAAFTYAYQQTRSLATPIALHTGNNILHAFLAYGP